MVKRTCLSLALTTAFCCTASQAGKEFPEGMPASPPASARPGAQTTRVGDFDLSLTGCRLTYRGAGKTGAADLDFPLPCQFNRNAAGEVRVVRTGKNRTLLVESSRPADPATRLSAKDCITSVRGVIVTPNDIRLSAQTQRVARCLPADWDEKMFHAFAARTIPTAPASGR